MILDLPEGAQDVLTEHLPGALQEAVPLEIDSCAEPPAHNLYGYAPFDQLHRDMRPVVEEIAGVSLRLANTFFWAWGRGSELKPHIDRATLDWTVSIPLDHQAAKYPLYIDGTPYTADFGQGIVCNSGKVTHWREKCEVEQAPVLLLHYTEIHSKDRLDEVKVERGLLCAKQIERILSAEHEWVVGTTYTGTNRQGTVCWLHPGPEWDWLYAILDAKMLPLCKDPLLDGPDAIQLTRYLDSGDYFGWHEDGGAENTRILSATVLLQDAEEGGQFEIEPSGSIDMAAGDMVIFGSHMQHRVLPVHSGTRYSLVRWLSQ